MSSTNKTANYDLTQFLGTDKPAWLVDYNGDMVKIDTAIKNAADAASAAQSTATGADGKADSALTDVSALSSTVSAMGTTVAYVQGSVNTINSLIGNGEPTTTDKTLIGAVNEINAEVTPIPVAIEELAASVVSVSGKVGNLADLTTTVKTDLVSALNEVNSGSTAYHEVASVTADGTKTIATLLGELWTAVSTNVSSLSPFAVVEFEQILKIVEIADNHIDAVATWLYAGDNKFRTRSLHIASSANAHTLTMDTTATNTDVSSQTPSNGVKIAIFDLA